MSARTFPLITVTVPHQYEPRAATWDSADELTSYCAERAITRSDDASLAYLDSAQDVSAALEYLADDLHALDVWEHADARQLARALELRRYGDPKRTTAAIEHAIKLGWLGKRGECADCGCEGPVCATPNGEIEFGGMLFKAARERGDSVLCGSKRDGEPVCDECEEARDEAEVCS